MKMKKLLSVVVFSMILSFLSLPVYATEQQSTTTPIGSFADQVFTEWPSKSDVQIDKVWTVGFNASLLPSTINDKNIQIVDSDGQSKSIKFELIEDGRKIKIIPLENYEHGGEYTLYISKGLISIPPYNLKMVNSFKMQFTIVEVKVEDIY